MVKDDYDVILCRLLIYLYAIMKRKTVYNDVEFDKTVRGKLNDTPKLVHRSTDFGLNPEIEEDRKMFLEITRDIIQNAAEKRMGSWR